MSKYGISTTIIATELSEAVGKDEDSGEGFDMSAGLFGEAVSEWIRDLAEQVSGEIRPSGPVDGTWVKVADRMPKRVAGALGEIELYCKTSCGVEVCCYTDWGDCGELKPGYFDDTSVTEWLSIPNVTLAT